MSCLSLHLTAAAEDVSLCTLLLETVQDVEHKLRVDIASMM